MVLVVLDNYIQKSNTPTIQQLNTHFSARVTESVGGSLALQDWRTPLYLYGQPCPAVNHHQRFS